MVMTRPVEAAANEGRDAPPPRVVRRVPGVPGARAVVGGLLVALAGVGTFLSWQQATRAPDEAYAVATRTLRPGEPVTADAVRFQPIDLPAGIAGSAFTSPAELEGRVLVAPVGEGELVQLGAVSDQGPPTPAAEVSVALARDRAVDGRLEIGDTVDVYATHEATTIVARGVRVIGVNEAGGSFGDGTEVTVTLALTDGVDGAAVVHAAREGQITLVRTTHVTRDRPVVGEAGGPADATGTGGGAG